MEPEFEKKTTTIIIKCKYTKVHQQCGFSAIYYKIVHSSILHSLNTLEIMDIFFRSYAIISQICYNKT